MYKLLAVDMDGTLLREDKTISKMTLKAVHDARKKGVKVVLSSGRHLGGIVNYMESLNLFYEGEYAVTMNGCSVQEVVSKDYQYKKTLTTYDMNRIIELGKNFNADVELVTANCFYVDKYKDFFQWDADINNTDLKVINFDDLPKNTDVFKIMFVNDGDFLDRISQMIPVDFRRDYTVLRSGDNFLEFIKKGANKGTAVAYIADMLHISPEEVICIGDAENDTHMIKYAGLGVAMGNAYPSVKEAADYVTKTNEEDGVAYVINKFILDDQAI